MLTAEEKRALDDAIATLYYVSTDDNGLHHINLYADYSDTNEGLLQLAYDHRMDNRAQSMPEEGEDAGIVDVLKAQINHWYDNTIYQMTDDIMKRAGFDLASDNTETLRDYLWENYSFSTPYDHYLNQNMRINLLLDGDREVNRDFISIHELNEALTDGIDPEDMDDVLSDKTALHWLIEQQGYSISDLQKTMSDYENYLCSTFLRSGNSHYRSVSSEAHGIITSKFLTVSQTNQYRMAREAKNKLFGIPKNQHVYVHAKNRIQVHLYDGENVTVGPDKYLPHISSLVIGTGLGKIYRTLRKGEPFSDPELWEMGTYFVYDSAHGKLRGINFKSEREALDFVEGYALQAQKDEDALTAELSSSNSRKRKTAFVPPQLQHLKRTGPEYRNYRHASGSWFLKELKFRGGEFGNWLSQQDREANLDFAYDAFRDLARILRIRPEDVSLSGTLAIAFGARGRGGSGSGAAHYEPGRQVINLTKMSGAGCLAHEWGHALDHAIGIANGFAGLASEERSYKLPPVMWDLLRAMKQKSVMVPPEVLACEQAPLIAHCQKNIRNWIDGEKPDNLPVDLEKTWNQTAQQILSSSDSFTGDEYMQSTGKALKTKPEIELLSQLRKSVCRSGIPKNTKQQIVLWSRKLKSHEEIARATQPIERMVETDFYKGAKAFDGLFSRMGHGYWSSDCEMFARAFDCYISDRLKEAGYRSDYLSAYADSYTRKDSDGNIVAAVPMGEEREILNAHFDRLLADLKERGILTDHIENKRTHIKEAHAPSRFRTSDDRSLASTGQGRRVRYEQMSFEDLLFSAESRKQQLSHDAGPAHEPTR